MLDTEEISALAYATKRATTALEERGFVSRAFLYQLATSAAESSPRDAKALDRIAEAILSACAKKADELGIADWLRGEHVI